MDGSTLYVVDATFPFLFGRAFIEAYRIPREARRNLENFPSFLEGLSLRLELEASKKEEGRRSYFPSFLEGLSLRPGCATHVLHVPENFPSFLEGLSLRPSGMEVRVEKTRVFPFLFGGTFNKAD